MFSFANILGSIGSVANNIGRFASTFGNIGEGVSAVQSFMAQRDAEKQTRRANAAMMRAAETEAQLMREDATQRADAARRDAQRFRAQQMASFLKSGVTLDGSPMLVSSETQDMGNRNAQNILTNSEFSSRALIQRAEGNRQAVRRADIWGTGFQALGSFAKAGEALKGALGGGK